MRDDRDRVACVHSLRHGFGTLLQAAGVGLRTAQAAMRHSDPKLTANTYTDARLLDVAGAVHALPALELHALAEAANTGTGGEFSLSSSLNQLQANRVISGHLGSGCSAPVPTRIAIGRAARAEGWRTRGDSNPQPSVPKTDALSN